jgi:hypothetical protein
MRTSTQLTNPRGFSTDRMRFSDPIPGSIPDSKPVITYKRINISVINEDGTVGDLIIPTEKCYSFGVSENTNQETGKVNGFVMPLVLADRTGPTQAQSDFINAFNNTVDRAKEYLLESKEQLELYELEPADLKKLNPLYYKKEKGKVVEGSAPTLYAKLIVSKKQGEKIMTVFVNEETEDSINPLDLLGKHCYARGAIKFESIFIGNKISIQVKLIECQVTLIDFGFKRLLPRPSSVSVVKNETKNTVPMSLKNDDDDDDLGSLAGDDKIDEDEAPIEDSIKTIPKKVVKKVVKKVGK